MWRGRVANGRVCWINMGALLRTSSTFATYCLTDLAHTLQDGMIQAILGDIDRNRKPKREARPKRRSREGSRASSSATDPIAERKRAMRRKRFASLPVALPKAPSKRPRPAPPVQRGRPHSSSLCSTVAQRASSKKQTPPTPQPAAPPPTKQRRTCVTIDRRAFVQARPTAPPSDVTPQPKVKRRRIVIDRTPYVNG